jgi:outer membrane protein
MKTIKLALITVLLSTATVFGQKFAYVDTEYILSHIPEYSEAQKKLDEISAQWQAEIEKKYAEIDKLYKAFQAEHMLLTEDMKKKREEEIIKKEREVKDFQKQKFGYEGELFRKRKELVKPIQDKVYDAVQKVAEEKAYGVIFDKSSSNVTMIYTNSKLDESDKIIRQLGYNPGEVINKDAEKKKEAAPEAPAPDGNLKDVKKEQPIKR